MSTGSVSPWATAPVAARAFADIMSEELESNNFNCQAGIASQGEEQDYIYNEEDFMTPDELCAKRLAEKSALLNTPSINNDFVHNEDDFLTDEEKADRDFAMALAAQDEENILPENKDQKRGNSKVNVCASLLEHFTYGNSDHAGQRAQVSSSNFEAEELGAKLMGHAGSSGVAFRNGVANVDGTRVSKHDSLIDGLMNSMSLGELDGSGDMTGLMVSNTVSNSIKNFNSKQTKKGVYVGGGGRVSAKDSRSTSEAVLDETTRLLLFKMSQKGVFDEVHGVIKTGKESNVYHATRHRDAPLNVHKSSDLDQENCVVVSDRDATVQFKDSEEDEGEKEDTRSVASSARSHLIFENSDFDYHDVAVKVFKTTLNEFGNRIDYIKGDHRFSREKYAKNSNNKRKFIAQWVEKEFRNLCRAQAKGVKVPRPLLFKENVLVMEMIVEDTCSVSETGGNNGTFVNSPQLKEVESLSLEQWTSCYEQTLELVTDLYQKCRLVHADLSEYNLLLHNNEDVYVLDFGQALDTSHPEHMEYLLRDLKIVTAFFAKKGVSTMDIQEVIDGIVREGRAPGSASNSEEGVAACSEEDDSDIV